MRHKVYEWAGNSLNIGELLQYAREKAGLLQKDVAATINVKQSTMSGYENNASQPSIELLGELLRLYHVSPDEFFKLAGDPLLDGDALKVLSLIHI